MSTSLPLFDEQVVTLNASGYGYVKWGPQKAGESWSLDSINVSTTQASPNSANVPTVRVYKNAISASHQVGGTFSGIQDTAGGNLTVYQGEKLIIEWTGADANQTGTVTISGTVNYPGNRWVN